MFRLLRAIIRPSNELIQDYLIPSALWDPVTLTILSTIYHLRLGFPSAVFPSCLPIKTLHKLSYPQYMLHAPLISFFSIRSPEK